MQISLTSNIREVRAKLNHTQRRALPTANTRAVNKAVSKANTIVRRAIAEHTGLKQTLIKPLITIRRANKALITADLIRKRKGSGVSGFNLIHYLTPGKRRVGAFRKKPGVSYKLKGKTRTAKGSFIAPIQTCLLYTSPSPRDRQKSRMPSSA